MKPLANPFFVKFIIYFNDNQDFFECHEVLEDYWNSIPERNKEHPLTSYILLSTGMYHWRRGNSIGALRTIKKAQQKMASMVSVASEFTEGIDFDDLIKNIDNVVLAIEDNRPFKSFSIKVLSPEILRLVADVVPTLELLPHGSERVIHKHLLRDRSEIIRIRDEKRGRH